ncbi:MAG: hypothetical protein HXX80_02635 [Nitrososphaerales archaeon]|nr:hypothetical protein [Nitrososphaerales archaeon]
MSSHTCAKLFSLASISHTVASERRRPNRPTILPITIGWNELTSYDGENCQSDGYPSGDES